MFRLFRYLRGYVRESIIAPLFKMLEASFELFVPLVMANIIDVGIKNGDTAYIWRQCAVLIFLGVFGFGCSITAQYFAAKHPWDWEPVFAGICSITFMDFLTRSWIRSARRHW